MNAMIISGTYRITCLANERTYIGSTSNITRRLRAHELLLVSGRHHCHALQTDFQAHGMEAFVFEAIETIIGRRDYIRAEAVLVEAALATGNTYNQKLPSVGKARVVAPPMASPPPDGRPLMKIKEVAVLLRVTPRTVENFALGGGLPYLKVGRSIRFSRLAVEEWINPKKNLALNPELS